MSAKQEWLWNFPDLGSVAEFAIDQLVRFDKNQNQTNCRTAIRKAGSEMKNLDLAVASKNKEYIAEILEKLFSVPPIYAKNVAAAILTNSSLKLVQITNEHHPERLNPYQDMEYKVTGILSNEWLNRQKGFSNIKKGFANAVFVGKNGNHFVFLVNSHAASGFDNLHYGQSLLMTTITMGNKYAASLTAKAVGDDDEKKDNVDIEIDWSLTYKDSDDEKDPLKKYVHLKLGLQRPRLDDVCVLLVNEEYLEANQASHLNYLMLQFGQKIEKIENDSSIATTKSSGKKKSKKNDLVGGATQCIFEFGSVAKSDPGEKVIYDVVGQKVGGLPAKRVTHGDTTIADISDHGIFGSSIVINMFGCPGTSGAGVWNKGRLTCIVECDYNSDAKQSKLRCIGMSPTVTGLLLYPFKNGLPIECDPFVACGSKKKLLVADLEKAYKVIEREARCTLYKPFRASKIVENVHSKGQVAQFEFEESKANYNYESWPDPVESEHDGSEYAGASASDIGIEDDESSIDGE